MYELEFEYDSDDGVKYVETDFQGTYEEMVSFVSSHGLIKYLRVYLVK